MHRIVRDSLRRPATILGALLLATAPGMLIACNTVEGAGEDVESAGDAIDDAAEDAND